MYSNLCCYLKHFYDESNLVERIIISIIAIGFIVPITLPNCYHFGYIEIKPQLNCKILDTSLFNENNVLTSFDEQFYNDIPRFFNIHHGGKYINKNCKDAPQVAIIIPYRNRSEHLTIFLQHIHPYLVKQNAINYQIFIIEQNDNSPFNRGSLLNIGFVEARLINPNIDCFIFHDVDILPLNLEQLYRCSNLPQHLCSHLDKFRYVLIYPNLFGGVISVGTKQFLKTNGYSNLYKGWGGEDDDFYDRVKHHFQYINRYPKDISRCIMLTHHQYQANPSRSELLKSAISRSFNDGLINLNKTYILNNIEHYPLYSKIKVSFVN